MMSGLDWEDKRLLGMGNIDLISRYVDVPKDQIDFLCAGINHLAWLTELKHRGVDLYPKIFKRARTEPDVYESDPVRFEMMFAFGAFITGSSGHLSEYVPYFRKRKDLLKRYCRDGYRGGSSFYADSWPGWRKASDKRRRELAKDPSKFELKRGYEYASEIIEGHAFNRPKVIYGSVPNNGLISNLPADGVVEVATLVDNTGFNPCKFGPLPPQMAAICASHMPVYDLTVRGIMNQDRDAIYHAMMLDPLSAAVCSPAEIMQMTDEMALAEKKFIPKFMTKGLSRPRGAGKKVVRKTRSKTKDKGPFEV
jgi:alpha-galactosidase